MLVTLPVEFCYFFGIKPIQRGRLILWVRTLDTLDPQILSRLSVKLEKLAKKLAVETFSKEKSFYG